MLAKEAAYVLHDRVRLRALLGVDKIADPFDPDAS